MSSLRQIKQQIKFSLNNLSAENAYHDFESICRHFSRKRLGLNILPATGPVSAGGDQGRDFETYTVIPEIMPQLLSNQKVIPKKAAFACTIQASGIPTKIKKDAQRIVSVGEKVDIIYFFSREDIHVSKRHELQNWASQTYSIVLEIFDGEALSEELATNDLFWVAEEYLHIPADLFPKTEDLDYIKLKEKWESKNPTAPNYADFGEVKELARQALFDSEVKQDLLFWLQKLLQFLEVTPAISAFKRKVLYEIVAIRMRGMRDLNGWEQYIHNYFDLNESFNYQVEAQEACVVLNYAYGASIRGAANFSDDDLKRWRALIGRYAEDELKKDYPKSIKAVLYELKGYLLLTDPNRRNINEGLDWWLKLASMIEETPLFPLERFSDTLTAIVPIVGENSKFEELITKIDQLLASRVGNFAVADKCRDRALEYKKAGSLIKALREFHGAKVNWFADETLYGSLVSMMLISNIYFELGLMYAAKYYAMATIYVASRSGDDEIKSFITRGFTELFEIEYRNGEWAHFFEHATFALKSLGIFLDDSDSEGVYEKIVFYSSTVYAITNILDKEKLLKYVDDRISGWEIKKFHDHYIPMAEESWSKVGSDKIIQKLKTELSALPFSDVGLRRECRWKACGIRWHVSWENGLQNNSRAEQLIALIQIILAETADRDLYLLSTDAEISIDFGEEFYAERSPSNDLSMWSVTLPHSEMKGDAYGNHKQTLGIAAAIIMDLSLLPSEKLGDEIELLFTQGLTSKAFSGNSYEVVFTDLTPRDLYEEILPLRQINYLKSIEPSLRSHIALSWKDGLIKEYDHAEEIEKIKSRYERAIIPIGLTLRKLNVYKPFQKIVKKLRHENWKDWHILMAISQIAVNYRVNRSGHHDTEETKRLFFKEIDEEESEISMPIPLLEFSEEAIRRSLFMTLPSTLKMLRLELKTDTPNADAIQHFLSKRLNYWDNDVEHDNIFNV